MARWKPLKLMCAVALLYKHGGPIYLNRNHEFQSHNAGSSIMLSLK